MRFLKSFTAAAVSAVSIFAISLLGASPAGAATGRVILFEHGMLDWSGQVRYVEGGLSAPNLKLINFNDTVSSITNASDMTYCFYMDSDYRGAWFALGAGWSQYVVPNGTNDKISSLRPC